MSSTTGGWLLFAAAIGMMFTLLSGEVVGLGSWAEAVSPAFVGKFMAHVGVVLAAFVGGKLIPSTTVVATTTTTKTISE